MRKSNRTGAFFIAISVLLLAISFGGSWLLAPSVSAESDSVANETNVVGVHGGGVVQMTSANGEVKWEYGNASRYFDTDANPDGTVLATFTKPSQQCEQFESPCARTGVRIIDPEPSPHVAYEWTYPVRDEHNSEVHDADRLPSGDILIAGMEYERVFILNPETERITWMWNASEYYDEPADPTQTDWLHINDVDRIGEERYLVSVRNANQLLVIERGEGVVEVINENRDGSVIRRQHNPQWLGNDTALVADSHNNRVVELQKHNDQWEVIWSLESAGGVSFQWPRDADRLKNGHTLITDSSNNRIVEVTEQGTVVASYRTPRLPYEADRLPGDETVGGPVHGDATGVLGTGSQDIPILTRLLTASRFVVTVPFWVSEIHVLSALVSVMLVLGGVERLLSRQVTAAVGWIDSRLTQLYDLSEKIATQLPALLCFSGATILLFGAVSPDLTGFKLGIGALLLNIGWYILLSDDNSRFLHISVGPRTQALGKLLIVALSLPISAAILYSGIALPGSLLLDSGVALAVASCAILVLSASADAPANPAE